MINFLDGSLIVGIITALLGIVKILYDLHTEQGRMRRVIFGADDDITHPGLLSRQQENQKELEKRISDMEHCIEDRFDAVEKRMIHRHEEVSYALNKMIQNMNDPPKDVKIGGPYGDEDRSDD